MLYHNLVRAMTLLVLMSCSSIVLADTCPPANGQIPANWTPMGDTSTPQPFKGAMYGLFGPTSMSCKYYTSDPMSGYVLVSTFPVQKPNTYKDPNWQYISGYITCLSSNIENCQFTAIN